MKTYTIRQKMSGTGTIHDLASQHCDREIKFPQGAKYAVVLAAYYGSRGYTTHRTAENAVKSSRRNAEFSHSVIDTNGNHYHCDYYMNELIKY